MLSCVTEGGLILSCQKMGLHPTRFWINELNGRRTGILTIKDLAAADAETVGELVGKSTADKFISMAKLIDDTSKLGSLGIERQSAELLVKAGRIDSIDKLKNANADDLYNIMKEAIASGKVEVPADYSLKKDDVKRWVESAQ